MLDLPLCHISVYNGVLVFWDSEVLKKQNYHVLIKLKKKRKKLPMCITVCSVSEMKTSLTLMPCFINQPKPPALCHKIALPI